MTSNDVQPFYIVIGGACSSFAYLDPPMDTGVVPTPDFNRNIVRNRQFFSLANQVNADLKIFMNSVPSCTSTSAETAHSWYINFARLQIALDSIFIHIIISENMLLQTIVSLVDSTELLLLLFLVFLKYFIKLLFQLLS